MDMRGDGRYVIAGLASAVVLPSLVFLADIPFYAAVPAAGVLFAAIAFILAPRRPLEGIDIDALNRGDVAAAQAALEEAGQDLAAIEAAAGRIRTKDVAAAVKHLAASARGLLQQVEADPSKLSGVRRLVAVYLPRTREIARQLARISRGAVGTTRTARPGYAPC
jgi:hypothetical protein